MKFETEVFISYAHLDNQSARLGHEWISDFHRVLELQVAQLLGKEVAIWRDPKLHGNDMFADTLIDRLKKVALLVSVLSPRYLKSEWTRRELEEFCQAADSTGGLEVENKARIFKVIKTPVSRDLEMPPLPQLLGYEFFKPDQNGHPRELDDPDEKEYWAKISDIAHDMCELLEILNPDIPAPAAMGERKTVYLAEATFDLRLEHDAIKRDLRQHGYTVLPSRPLPVVAPELALLVREELTQCDMSVHLVGKNYGLVPEDGTWSILEMQDQLARERAAKGKFERLVWIRPDAQITDQRQQKFVDQLRLNPHLQHATDLLETSIEDLKWVIHERLKQKAPETVTVRPAGLKLIYLIFDHQDLDAIAPWRDYLFEHCEVICSVFDGDEAEIREFHEETLRTSDAVLIHHGAGSEMWLRRKLGELRKCPAYGRTEPFRAVGIVSAPPATPAKQAFKTHDAMLIAQPAGFSAEAFLPFLNLVKGI